VCFVREWVSFSIAFASVLDEKVLQDHSVLHTEKKIMMLPGALEMRSICLRPPTDSNVAGRLCKKTNVLPTVEEISKEETD
jgi:hypothetical protein